MAALPWCSSWNSLSLRLLTLSRAISARPARASALKPEMLGRTFAGWAADRGHQSSALAASVRRLRHALGPSFARLGGGRPSGARSGRSFIHSASVGLVMWVSMGGCGSTTGGFGTGWVRRGGGAPRVGRNQSIARNGV